MYYVPFFSPSILTEHYLLTPTSLLKQNKQTKKKWTIHKSFFGFSSFSSCEKMNEEQAAEEEEEEDERVLFITYVCLSRNPLLRNALLLPSR